MNTSLNESSTAYSIDDYYIVCSLSAIFALISIVLCTLILMSVWGAKHRLHTVNHLLVCNTCVASMFYCFIINHNYVFLIFIQSDTSDVNCRWRAYLAYVGVTGVVYSYVTQAISRFFFSILYNKCRWLTTFKAHYVLILIQWAAVLLITSPAIITKDITFFPRTLCWVPLEYPVHVAYTVVAYYIFPVSSIVIIYIYIYYRVRRAIKDATTLVNTTKKQKIDLRLLRNILLLLGIYLGGGLPFLLFVITSIKDIYLINLVTLSLSVPVEKLSTIMLDRELRLVIRSILGRRTLVQPWENVSDRVRNAAQLRMTQRRIGPPIFDTTMRM